MPLFSFLYPQIFFSSTKKRERFLLNNIILKSATIIHSTLQHKNITLELPNSSDVSLTGYPNELQQAILVILNNAKDALLSNKTPHPKITIKTTCKTNVVITICDNAGGVDVNIINKIFDSYFSTKKSEQSMGIGLYISKMIIETNMNGNLVVHNTNNGACFTITLPYDIAETL